MAERFRNSAPVALIVEDDPELRELAGALLEETDLRVVECEDAEQALAFLSHEGETVAMMFVDVRLPGLLDGLDLVRRARRLWPEISVVVTSGYGPTRDLPDGVVYMQKPWLALDVLMQAEYATARANQRQAAH
jgi:CheY-like chemotaxis protein